MVHSVQHSSLRIMANWWCLSSILMSVDVCITYHIKDSITLQNSSLRTEDELGKQQGGTNISRVSLQVVGTSSGPQAPHDELLLRHSKSMLPSEPNQTSDRAMLSQSTPLEVDTSHGMLKNTSHFNSVGGLQNSSLPSVETHQQGSLIIDPNAQPCSEEASFQPTARYFLCPNVASFYRFAHERSGGEPLAVRVARVDGGLNLASLADVKLSLFLQHSNLTHFSSENLHQQKTLSNLTKLDLSDNPDFDAASLTKLGVLPLLSYLQLHGTAATTLGSHLMPLMKQLPKLQHLDLSYTGLQELPLITFHHNPELKYLNIAGNVLNQVTLDEGLVQQLTHLNISGCGLKEVKVQAISTNSTTLLEHSQEPILHTLDVSYNQLMFLPAPLIDALTRGYSQVVITHNSWHKACMHCSLYHLWHYTTKVAPDSVVGAESLQCFTMEALHSCGWEECPRGCHCNKNSKTVNCKDVGLETIPIMGPVHAETLILSNNHLSDMTGIDSPVWCNLKTLNLEHNQLKILVPKGMTGHCHCQGVEDYYSAGQDCFPQQLQKLILNHNSVKGILATDCPMLYPLQEIHLAQNMMQTLGAQDCGYLQQLKVLNLEHNNITNMEESDFATYPNLEKLHISHNSLMTLQPRITDLMPKLRILDISHNHLETFSDKLSSPHSPFSSMESSPLEELYLDNNELSQIEPMFGLKHISSLKKLTLDNNLWSCHCSDLNMLQGRVWKELNLVMIEAVRPMKCHLPRSLRDTVITADTVTKVCHEASLPEGVFMSLVASLFIIVISVVICYSLWSRRSKLCLFGKPSVPKERDDTVGRKYDVFVVHSPLDYELVRQHVIIPLTHRGYSVAWHDNVFRPGDWVLENVERAVRHSRRMLIIASDNIVKCSLAQQVIRRGRHEEFDRTGFQILALVTETLPRALRKDLYEIVALRTHVLLSSRDYIAKICNFLPAPAPLATRHDGLCLTETDIQTLLQHFEEICQRERQQQVHLSEVFSMQRESSHVTVNVDIATSNECNGGITIPPLSPEDRRSIAHRFKTRPPPAESISQPTSLNYSLIDHDNEEEEEEVPQIQGFTRCSFTRISCKF